MVLRRLAFLLAPGVFAELDALRADRTELISVQRKREARLRETAEKARREAELHARELARRDEQARRLMEFLWNRLSRNEQKVIATLVRNGNENITAAEIFEQASFSTRSQITRVTRDLSNLGILRVCLHGSDGERCFTLSEGDMVAFVREKVARFDQRRRAPIRKKSKKVRTTEADGIQEEQTEVDGTDEDDVDIISNDPSDVSDELTPTELVGLDEEAAFEGDIGYRFDFGSELMGGLI
ncbi:MAG: hypothetical protein QF415_04065 [Candidatus Undinarchaeales archaeon]|jgi:hypothetical protein|nr:hypothetical protein [Candidatus Undinarchaeales archaeon]MDP7493748.1 hypothetical protein [Candidatus Undinarchaeales archaeon]